MSPHAVPYSPTSSAGFPSSSKSSVNNDLKSNLRRVDDNEIHDLICVGFGPASLAIAVALHDALDNACHSLGAQPKVRFLEKQKQFRWHAGMLLPGAKMQISFIKDMATLRNPRSEFTFINYLHRHDRLVQFTNLGTFLPQRIEYEDYMKWCASWFEDVVDYDQTVQAVEVGNKDPLSGAVEYFNVSSLDQTTGVVTTRKAKHVVIATGGQPNIPKVLPTSHPRVIHSSQYVTNVTSMFPPGQHPRSVAVIGAGQSAAEVFNNIPSLFPDAKVHLLIRGSALRPSDDSPFVNEVFNPGKVDDYYSQEPTLRAQQIARDKATNYSVVRLELIEHIYSMLYSYRIQYENEVEWPQRIHTHRELTGLQDIKLDGKPAVRLHLQNNTSSFRAAASDLEETLDVDLVVVATGYRRDAHEDILKNVRHLMPGGAADPTAKWTVGRDYCVHFAKGAVSSDAGIWLQGCNEKTHGLSDTLLSILSVRGGEIVDSIFNKLSFESHGAAIGEDECVV
ncbi:hydroxylase [Acrodontium crateriforme]|uniref:L-ornithine N(5)-monooxygenase [NAD(P)H] n=1 Tax=Acrodontium crateriforme TaxID=150365 RepID=A0AAQ3M0I4_9PEZI|nr:hydroxylase [Acrodontium crateriforme]